MLPTTIKPMLAAKADRPFDPRHHLFEVKWHGIRCLAFVRNGQVRLQSRRLLDISAQFPELKSRCRLPPDTVVDGELVIMEDGKPSLAAMQRRLQSERAERFAHLGRRSPVMFMVFDLLYRQGESLLQKALTDRRALLLDLDVTRHAPGVLFVPEAIRHYGFRSFVEVAARGLEGIVAKRWDSMYLPGQRSRAWMKVKCQPLYQLTFQAHTAGLQDLEKRTETGQ